MAKSTTPKAATERAVIVTTEHRGVFFGYTDDTSGAVIHLKRARLVVYWSRAMRGFMGLANMGPDRECKIGPPVNCELRGITGAFEVEPEAVKKFEAAPWS